MKNLEYMDQEVHTPFEYRASNGDLFSGEIVEFSDGVCEVRLEGEFWKDTYSFEEAQEFVERNIKKQVEF